MKARFFSSLILGALVTIPCVAHHSHSALYILNQDIVIDGIVSEFQFTNPHVRILFEVTTSDNKVEEWMAEGGTPNVLRRWGWNGEEVKPGDYIRISGNPARDGSNLIHWITVTLPDGSELFGEDYDFDSVDIRRRSQ